MQHKNLIEILNITDNEPNPLNMKSKDSIAHRTQIVESAISLLKDGISSGNSNKKTEAVNAIPDSFSWTDLEVLKMEWDELVYVKDRYV